MTRPAIMYVVIEISITKIWPLPYKFHVVNKVFAKFKFHLKSFFIIYCIERDF